MKQLVRKSYKYRIYPTKSQITNMENQFSMCRYLYNWNLTERIEAYEKEQHSISYNEQQNKLPELKKEKPWFKSVHSQVLQDVLKRLDNAYKHFFRRVKTGEVPGFPKFKKRGQWNSITYPQYSKHPSSDEIVVPKLGSIKLKYHREISEDVKIKTLTITKEADKWFACFSVEQELEIELKQDFSSSIGIDLGLIDFVYTSNNDSISVPKYFRKKEQQLTRLQRRLSKTTKRSKKYYQLLKAIQKCHYKIKCQRNDFLHKSANNILSQGNAVIHEDLKIKNMMRRPKPKQDDRASNHI